MTGNLDYRSWTPGCSLIGWGEERGETLEEAERTTPALVQTDLLCTERRRKEGWGEK